MIYITMIFNRIALKCINKMCKLCYFDVKKEEIMDKKKNNVTELNYARTLLLGVVFLSISLLNGAHDNMTSKILDNQFHMDYFWRGFIMAIDNMLAMFMLPMFGRFSDACESRWGKRKPFVFWGTIAACLFLMLFPVALKVNNEAFFIVVVCLFLISLATYRSAGVALVADVTIKPLRSKANAIINLMGAVAFILGTLFTMFFYKDVIPGTTDRSVPIWIAYALYTGITLVCLFIYMVFIPEKKWTAERERIEDELNLDDEAEQVDGVKVKLDKEHFKSLILVLASIVLWTFGYNAITTNYSVYASEVLGTTDGGFAGPTLIAGIAAFAAYIPIGWMATKFGRRKTIIFGLIVAAIGFGAAIFLRSGWAMYVVFVMVGIAQASITVNTLPMVVEFANKNTIGQFTGYYYIATQTAQALSPLAIGAIMSAIIKATGSNYQANLTLFPYGTLFVVLAIIPLIFTKYGDAKVIAKGSALEMLDIDD